MTLILTNPDDESDDVAEPVTHELRGENNVQYEKQIVPLKKHIHCNCEENEPNLCAVHEDDEKYEESISFAKRMWKYGGYDDVQSTNTD